MGEKTPTTPPEYEELTRVSKEQNRYWSALSPEPSPQQFIAPIVSQGQTWQNRPLRPSIAHDTIPTPEAAARFHHFAGAMEQREQQRQQEILRQRAEWLQQYTRR